MIEGVAAVAIFSEDSTRLAPFYRDVLGLPVTHELPGLTIFFADGGPQVLVGTHSEVHGQAKEPVRQIPELLTADVWAEYRRLQAAGVEFLGEPAASGPVIVVTLRDPEGNLVNLLQRA